MNLTQYDRLKQVTGDTLIVGVDVGSQTHFSEEEMLCKLRKDIVAYYMEQNVTICKNPGVRYY